MVVLVSLCELLPAFPGDLDVVEQIVQVLEGDRLAVVRGALAVLGPGARLVV